MAGGDAPTADERQQILGHIKDAYKYITGSDMQTKSKPGTIRQFEDWLREAAGRDGFKFSNSEVRAISEGRAWKSATPRDEVEAAGRLKALDEIRGALSGFSLPKIGD
jgi:hypothetical protein